MSAEKPIRTTERIHRFYMQYKRVHKRSSANNDKY